MQQTAIGWLVLRLTGSAAELGLVLAVGGVPSLLFGPWGGTVADRVSLRGLLIGTQTAYGVLAAAVGTGRRREGVRRGDRRDQRGRRCRSGSSTPPPGRPSSVPW